MLAIDALTGDQRASLMRLAEWGEEGKDGIRKPLTAARLAQERDKILDRERIPLPDFDEKGEAQGPGGKKAGQGVTERTSAPAW